MLLGLVYPVLQSLYLSFFDWKIGTDFEDAPFVGLRHFTRMVSDPGVHESIWVTFKFGFWTISIEMILGVSLALLLEKPIRGASIFRTLFILPLMISPVVVGLVWRYLFDARIGWINYYLGAIGIEPQVWLGDAELAFFAIVFTDIWQWTPFIFIIVIAGLQALPILTGGGPGRATELLSLHIYNRAFDTQQLGYASAISVLLIVIVFGLSLGILKLGNPMQTKADI